MTPLTSISGLARVLAPARVRLASPFPSRPDPNLVPLQGVASLPVTIRRATAEDRDGIVNTIHAVYVEYGFAWHPEGYHRDLYEFESHYLRRKIPFWVAEVDGEIRGTAALETHPLIPGKGVVTVEDVRRIAGTDSSLERVYVHPAARRLGIGRRLNLAAIAHARENGGRAIEIWSDKKFEAAHAMYRSLGAVEVGERLCSDPEQSPEWGFRLDL